MTLTVVVGDGSGCGKRDVWRSTALYQALRAYIIRVKLDSVDQAGPCFSCSPDSILQWSTTYYVLLHNSLEELHSKGALPFKNTVQRIMRVLWLCAYIPSH